jgi:hypothetical protein
MRRRFRSLISSIFLFVLAHSFPLNCLAQSSDLAFSRNARTFETQDSTLVMKGLALSCLTVTVMPDGLPCNPALAGLDRKGNLNAEVQLSNGYSAIQKIQNLLAGQITQDTVDSLFADGKIIQIEATGSVGFQSKHLNGSYTPLSVKGFSVVRNEANPDIELYAVQEQGFKFQTGSEILEGFYAGLQTRFVNRKFIRQRFKLVELGTPAGKDILKPKSQNATYIEPGFTYLSSSLWKPRASIFVANPGFFSETYSQLPTPIEVQFGFGISPPLWWGDLELSLEYRSMNYEEEWFQKIRAGALYHFGSAYLSAGVDANGLSGGVFYGLESVNAGIVYTTTKFINEDRNFFTQTVYVQLGWQI